MNFDVVVVGYGPTGMTLAALLGQAGHRVAVLERYTGLYNLPRAATFDDETMRLLQKLGIADAILPSTHTQRTYDWCNAAGEVLIRNQFTYFGHCGWPQFNMMFQPELERQLDVLCRNIPNIEIFQDHRVTSVVETEDAVDIFAVRSDGSEADFRATYVVACDGGNSTVRNQLAVEMDDYGFQEPWLVCDFELLDEVELPMAMQYGDPEQPTSIVSLGPRHHRFSFMLDSQLVSPEDIPADTVWARVSRWLTPEHAQLIRVAPYTFRSTVAQQWRIGRVLLAGDAAHQMPPFLGQGMCSGMRDAHNLGWKLPMVITGEAGQEVLDTYVAERSPHVRTITEKAVELGRVQTVRDPVLARQRDEELLRRKAAGVRPDAFEFPPFSAGFLSQTSVRDRARGELFPQAMVRVPRSDEAIRFDDAHTDGWFVVAKDVSVLPPTTPLGGGPSTTLDAERLVLTDCLSDCSGHRHLEDTDGVYEKWFNDHACGAAIVRPDWHVFGSATSGEQLTALMREASSGWKSPTD